MKPEEPRRRAGAPATPVGPPAVHPALAGFQEPVQAWFTASFGAPTRAQELAWPAIREGACSLLVAPTGSGKTLAAFLAALDRLLFEPSPAVSARCRVLYLSPLRALAVDVERNLRTPLAGITRWAERLGRAVQPVELAVRTGDTPSRDRARFARAPADILITTPESLYLLLTSQAREALRPIRLVIVDEVHALLGTKRGAHLALSLERLEALCETPLQRIGLSATQRPLEEGARWLGGRDGGGTARAVEILDAGSRKALDLRVEVAVEDMARLGEVEPPPRGAAAQGPGPSSIWPAIHPLILDLIRAHRATLIFVNSRRLAERLAAALNELASETAGRPLVRAHHGSVAREQRLEIEEALKAGQLPAIVATSSLELGIDMGTIDLVVHVEAPPSVTSGLQRIGRAGHRLDVPSKGIILPKYRGDLLACAALTAGMREGAVEATRYPRLPLDVLAQQIVAMVSVEDWDVDGLARLCRQAAPFADLSAETLGGVLDMLSGRYPADEFAELRPRLTWDRLAGRLTTREGAHRVAIANGGTIPDRGLYGVFLADAPAGRGRVGELDEEMVFESRVGETFLLGASSWRIEEITHDRVLVSPAPGVPGKMPFWHGDAGGRSVELGRAIGALTRTLRALPAGAAGRRLAEAHALSEGAARNLVQYLDDQAAATGGAVPDDRTLVVERYRDELGDWRVCLLSPFGGRIHAPWAMAVVAMARARGEPDPDVLWTDDGIVARFPDVDQPPPVEVMLPDPDTVEGLVIRQLGAGGAARQASQGAPATALFASRFREAAGRALLLPRRRPGQRLPLWQQRKRASDLLQVAARFDSFPIVLETYRECLRDVFDIPALRDLLRNLGNRTIRVVTVDTTVPSPFAAALLFSYVANFLYEGDAPLAERRAQALTVDPAQLRQLLGDVELRELVDPAALAILERHLQRLTADRGARHPDGLHDLLLELGELSADEIRDRVTRAADAPGWIDALVAARRAVRVTIAGEVRLIAAEDAGRYRDALGLPPPPGLPHAFLEPPRDPLGDLVSRYARTHGPFRTSGLAARLGLGVAPVDMVLRRFAGAGRVVEGEFRPDGAGREWCEVGVLKALRQRSLARLRREVEPVEPAVLGRFAVAWHGIGTGGRGVRALLDVVAQLEGTPIPASVLETEVLPARLARYEPAELDALMASGHVVWVGAGALGPKDGRVCLHLAEHASLLVARPAPLVAPNPLHQRIRDYLTTRGASFFVPLLAGIGGGFVPDVLGALWDLVWTGGVTNDTLQPLRAVVRPRDRRGRGRAARARRAARGAPAGALGPPGGAPPEAAGRWSLVQSWLAGEPTPTARLGARTRALLDRQGILTRETVAAEGVEGGFSAVYAVLRAMEEAGRVRRGYFVAGRGATQFALPGAVDRLRALRTRPEAIQAVRLAATDPANPYGLSLPWPDRPEGRRPMRVAGALVVLVDGELAAWLGPGESHLLTFREPDFPPERESPAAAGLTALARALAEEPARSGRALVLLEVDGRPIADSPVAPALREAGFAPTPDGFVKRV